MKHMRHIRRVHNGKDRRTGQKIRNNRNRGGLADPRAEARRQKWVEDKRQKKVNKNPRGPCCKDDAARLAKNEQLLSELRSMKMDKVWNDNRGTFEPKVPRSFIRANRPHIPHFRQYVKAMNLPYNF